MESDPTFPAADHFTAAEPGDVRSVQADYYGTDEKYTVTLPDGITFVECKTMTEGDRQKYQSSVNRDVRVSRQSGDMHLKLSTGEERMALLTAVIVGWNVVRAGAPVPFSKGSPGSELNKFILQAPPSIVDHIERSIRRKETWLLGEATVEDLDAQIAELTELREKKAAEEVGNGS
jgi:hypothetical protein